MNTLSGTITAVNTSDHLSILTVAVNGDSFHLLLAEATDVIIGTDVTLAFKETEIILSKDYVSITANAARATVQSVKQGKILSQITLDYHAAPLQVLVPTSIFDTLAIHEGNEIVWMIQPSEISLLRGNDER